MKILTQNLHCFAENDYIDNFNRIAQYIVDNEIEVICLQEVAQPSDGSIINEKMNLKHGNSAVYIRDQIQKIGGELYEVYFSFSHLYYDEYDEGVAILTKKKPIEWKEHIISDITDITIDRRTAIEIRFEDGLSISSLHLGIATDVVPVSPALAQFQKLGIVTSGKIKLYFGDYNIIDETEEYETIIENGYFDLAGVTAKGNTKFKTIPTLIDGWYNSDHNSAKRIDYGFSNTLLEVRKAHVVFASRDEMVSDHFGMYFEVIV